MDPHEYRYDDDPEVVQYDILQTIYVTLASSIDRRVINDFIRINQWFMLASSIDRRVHESTPSTTSTMHVPHS